MADPCIRCVSQMFQTQASKAAKSYGIDFLTVKQTLTHTFFHNILIHTTHYSMVWHTTIYSHTHTHIYTGNKIQKIK